MNSLTKDTLGQKAAEASSGPGVYLMKDSTGQCIYVGKAANLKKRLLSYFSAKIQSDLKTASLISKINDFDTMLTSSEHEALILESNLIKKYRPRYNVILKDDKRYPLLRLNIGIPYPDISVVRKSAVDGARYFGPFTTAGDVKKILKIIKHAFKIRQCKPSSFNNRNRPCLNYQMNLCFGPCCLLIKPENYRQAVKEVILFLEGRLPELIERIRQDMIQASDNLAYEKAAVLRDKLFAVQRVLEKQAIVFHDLMDRDIIAGISAYEMAVVVILWVRSGYLTGSRSFIFSASLASDHELIGAFIRQYYEKAPFIPDEVLVSSLPEDEGLITEHLKTIKGCKVSLTAPKRGDKSAIVLTAIKNAEQELARSLASEANHRDLLSRLQQRLKMNKLPAHIECIDNSHTSGTQAVSGIVVFKNGKPDKSSYRKYIIKTVKEPNDYAYMAEVITRRFGKGENSMPYPDLLMVDGGKGQVAIAKSIIQELGIEPQFDIIGIAKKNVARGDDQDKIYRPGISSPVNLGHEADILLFLQRIRDEAHRFAVTFHRKQRQHTIPKTSLDTIAGVGTQRKRKLLKHFGSMKKIQSASIEELASVPGISRTLAEKIHAQLHHPAA